MAKRTSKKVRKAKNAKPNPVSLSRDEIQAEVVVEDAPVIETTTEPLRDGGDDTAATIDQRSDGLTPEQAQIVGAANVGLTPSAYVYGETQDPEPPLEDIIETFLTPDQQAEVREQATIEAFGRPVRDGREAILSRLDSKLKEL